MIYPIKLRGQIYHTRYTDGGTAIDRYSFPLAPDAEGNKAHPSTLMNRVSIAWANDVGEVQYYSTPTLEEYNTNAWEE